jgi:hypothetical protein
MAHPTNSVVFHLGIQEDTLRSSSVARGDSTPAQRWMPALSQRDYYMNKKDNRIRHSHPLAHSHMEQERAVV